MLDIPQETLHYFYIFCITLTGVGLKSFQQLSVTHRKYFWIPPVSMLMAATDIAIILNAVDKKFSLVLVFAMGSGAAVGCISAMLTHDYFNKGNHEKEEEYTQNR